jgi:hypothetical protein
MIEQLKPRHRWKWFMVLAVGALALGALGLGGWVWWTAHERERVRAAEERERVRMEALRGLEGVWVDDSGQDVSYQFREDGEFLIRQKLPSTLAPFSGDPGVEFRPWGTWSRKGQSITVRTIRHWGFDLELREGGLLRGEYVLDQWSGEGEHSRTKTPVVLKKKPAGP